jgi:oxalate decarboxylase/phosphoglucose isomerase-like protein (cupin superfamily)
VFFILDGTYELTVGGQTSTAGPGTIVFIPRNVVHRFRNVGDTTARMLDWSLPGGQATTSRQSPISPPAAASPTTKCWRSAGSSTRTSDRNRDTLRDSRTQE